ncbi:MAG: PEP-CTERM sorting domain-containing protein [Terrimicrobiaceae bacterium]
MKIQNSKYLFFTLIAGTALASFVGTASAAIIQTDSYSGAGTSQTFYTVSSTDLVNQGESTFLSQDTTDFTSWSSDPASILNDGAAGPGIALDLADGTWTTTFNLNLSTNTLGYDITGVNTYAGWNDARVNQKYTLSYSTAAAPTTFLSLGTFTFKPLPSNIGDASTRVSLTEGTTGVLATNVASIRFTFEEPTDAGDRTVYREVDVLGVASVPEPSTFAMLLGGIGMLVGLRRMGSRRA